MLKSACLKQSSVNNVAMLGDLPSWISFYSRKDAKAQRGMSQRKSPSSLLTQVDRYFFDFIEEEHKIASVSFRNNSLGFFCSSLTNGKISAVKAEIFSLRKVLFAPLRE